MTGEKKFARHANAILIIGRVKKEGYFENHKLLITSSDNIYTLTHKSNDEIFTFTNERDIKEYLKGMDCL